MTEPADDTPQTPPAPRPRSRDKSNSYYYDDATGYELFKPEPDEDEQDDPPDDDKCQPRPA